MLELVEEEYQENPVPNPQKTPTMQELISQAKVADAKAREANRKIRRNSRLFVDGRFSGQSSQRDNK